MRVCGVMSGSSLDGIDVAIVDIARGRMQPVTFRTTPYPKAVRDVILAASDAATISRLHVLLGELYAEAIRETCRRGRVPLASVKLCGIHGQTIFHEGTPVKFLGRDIASTLQIGDPAVVAERTGIRTISNFRERDIAAGGKGAPLDTKHRGAGACSTGCALVARGPQRPPRARTRRNTRRCP